METGRNRYAVPVILIKTKNKMKWGEIMLIKQPTKEQIQQALQKYEIIQVNFIKTNGKFRQMAATQKFTYTKKTNRTAAPTQCVVLDTEINEIRSFRYDSVISILV